MRAEWLALALQNVHIGPPGDNSACSKKDVNMDEALKRLLRALVPLYAAKRSGELDLRSTLECVDSLLKVIQDEMGCSNKKYKTFLKAKGFNMCNGHVYGCAAELQVSLMKKSHRVPINITVGLKCVRFCLVHCRH